MLDTFPHGSQLSLGAIDLATPTKWAKTKDINRFLYIILVAKAGAAGSDIKIKLEQAKDQLGAGAVALGIERVFNKDSAVTSDKFQQDTAVTNESPAAIYDSTTANLATKDHIMLIQVRPHDLLVQQGYTCVRATVTGGTARSGVILFAAEGWAYNARDIAGMIAT